MTQSSSAHSAPSPTVAEGTTKEIFLPRVVPKDRQSLLNTTLEKVSKGCLRVRVPRYFDEFFENPDDFIKHTDYQYVFMSEKKLIDTLHVFKIRKNLKIITTLEPGVSYKYKDPLIYLDYAKHMCQHSSTEASAAKRALLSLRDAEGNSVSSATTWDNASSLRRRVTPEDISRKYFFDDIKERIGEEKCLHSKHPNHTVGLTLGRFLCQGSYDSFVRQGRTQRVENQFYFVSPSRPRPPQGNRLYIIQNVVNNDLDRAITVALNWSISLINTGYNTERGYFNDINFNVYFFDLIESNEIHPRGDLHGLSEKDSIIRISILSYDSERFAAMLPGYNEKDEIFIT